MRRFSFMEESGRFLRNNTYVHRVRMSEELVNGSEVQISYPAARGRSSKHNLSDMFFANEASRYLGHAATLQLVIFASASLNMPNVLPKPALS
jgi:hypothetical protein